MLGKNDLKEIKGLLRPLENGQKKLIERLDINTVSTMKIEEKIDKALELRIDVSDLRKQVKDRDERISQLEKF
ncbi:MAG: hypothetical protein WD231_03915 [Candidatus Woykebacteria bacterium]